MKAKVLSIALTLIALFVFGSAQAQSLSSYSAEFNEDTKSLTISDAKIGGFGKKTRTMTVTLYISVEGTTECQKTNPSGTMYKEFSTDAEGSDFLAVDGKGFGFLESLSVTASGTAGCPSGWNFYADGDANVTKAWVVITGYDSEGNIIKESEEIDIAF